MAAVPDVIPTNLPGRVIVRTGFDIQIPGAALYEGELAYTSDTKRLYIGNESNSPPWIPTSEYEGVLDWSKVDLKAKSIDVVEINGKSVNEFVSTTIINTGQVLTVVKERILRTVYGTGADFTDFTAAFAWLSQRTISTEGFVTLQLPALKISENKRITIYHPNGNRIQILGAPLKTPLPDPSTMAMTGPNLAQRISDVSTNLLRLRQSFSTEMTFTNGGGLDFRGDWSLVKNVLCTSDGVIPSGLPHVYGITCRNGQFLYENVSAVGFPGAGFNVETARCDFAPSSQNYFIGNQNGIIVAFSSLLGCSSGKIYTGSNIDHGISVAANCIYAMYPTPETAAFAQIVSACNGAAGFITDGGAYACSNNAKSIRNGNTGVAVFNTGSFYANRMTIITSGANNGVTAINQSLATLPEATVTATGGTAFYATSLSVINRQGSIITAAATPYSPALGVEGNQGSYIN